MLVLWLAGLLQPDQAGIVPNCSCSCCQGLWLWGSRGMLHVM